MAVLKCKMCGGDLNVTEESKIVECEFCGTTQTILTPDNEKKTNLYNRANRLRFANEFDKAASVFESLVAEFPVEAEAYWGLCLCKYGIEYVDDPATGKKMPTCHRTSYESIFDDSNFDMALEYADSVAKSIYREEAKSIDRIQKGILEIASKEKPFDIFICYKETDEKGERTIDSVLAKDIYDELTEKGYKVFFSRITLEDKLGQEYEPYIFSALNSAKIMLAIGTSYEYYNAIWVKNEWSRFLDLMKNDKKKTLIPCYRDIDAYDMPKEFKNLQGQDMGNLGFMQDLVRGISKILGGGKDDTKSAPTQVVSVTTNSNIENLLKRGNIALEDKDWDKANEFFEQVLDENVEEARAYLGKLMAELRFTDESCFEENFEQISDYNNYEKALRFADEELKKILEEYALLPKYNFACKKLNEATKPSEYSYAATIFEKLGDFRDSKVKIEFCNNRIKEIKTAIEITYNEAVDLYNSGNYKEATIKLFKCDNIKNTSIYLRKMLRHNIAIACGTHHTVGLKTNGTVIAVGNNYDGQCNTKDWKDIVSINAYRHTVGLKSDGTVIAIGDNEYGQCDIKDWKDIVSIACGWGYTVGLKTDGTVIAIGDNDDGQCDIKDWKDIVDIACGSSHTVGLKSDGTVIAAGDNDFSQCNIKEWKDIVAIACGFSLTVGLKTDGTVIATGCNNDGQCNIEDWKDIVSIACGDDHTVGLKADGTVIAAGDNDCGQCDIKDWKDIVSIACGNVHTVGLKTDGTVISVGSNKYGQCDVEKFGNILY